MTAEELQLKTLELKRTIDDLFFVFRKETGISVSKAQITIRDNNYLGDTRLPNYIELTFIV